MDFGKSIYPQLNNFSEKEISDFLTSYINNNYNNSNNKYNAKTVAGGPHDHEPPKGCEDPAGYEEDVERCHTDQYIEAAACGLLSPTVALAMTCGAAVIAKSTVCHDRAVEDNC
jgi:hypothetical protein